MYRQYSTKFYKKTEGVINMRKPKLSLQTLINANKKEILSNKEELNRIEKQLDEKFRKQLQTSN
jgi:hypothetical protein